MKTEWDAESIVKSYKESKYKENQIKILAELNGCDEYTIREILRKNGVSLEEKTVKKKVAPVQLPESVRNLIEREVKDVAYQIQELNQQLDVLTKKSEELYEFLSKLGEAV